MNTCCEYHVQGAEIHFEGKIKQLEEKLARTEAALERCREQRNRVIITDVSFHNRDTARSTWDAELEQILKG